MATRTARVGKGNMRVAAFGAADFGAARLAPGREVDRLSCFCNSEKDSAASDFSFIIRVLLGRLHYGGKRV